MAQVETPEAEVEEMEDKEMLQQKAQEEKMEQVAHKIIQEEVIKTKIKIRVMQSATIVINMSIMQMNARRSKLISQDIQMSLM